VGDDGRLETQLEAAQEATEGGRRGGPEWLRPFRGGRGFRDAVTETYEGLPAAGKLVLWAVVIAFFALIPELLPYVTADSVYWTLILSKIGIAALLALGLNVVVGFAGLLDLGYVAFFAVGAYAFALLAGAAR